MVLVDADPADVGAVLATVAALAPAHDFELPARLRQTLMSLAGAAAPPPSG